ncbi:RidA family protein [Sporosarcina soli]|uniref:RidA family protein n=1 Tax=Sporosarcina soli TaxID=334736 RepID=A0ABW0TJ32_9BACL
MRPEEKLLEMGITLPQKRAKGGNYVSCVQTGNLLYLSGSLSYDTIGKVGDTLSIEEGYQAAKEAILYALTTIKEEVGELSRVKKFVKLLGLINTTYDFTSQAKVMNGASDLLVELFGEEMGSHARTAVGVMLPRGAAVEIDVVVEVE